MLVISYSVVVAKIHYVQPMLHKTLMFHGRSSIVLLEIHYGGSYHQFDFSMCYKSNIKSVP